MSDHESKTILVAGATGKQGGTVARHLTAAGWKVRALTRDPDDAKAAPLRELGIELARGDTTDRASLDAAMEGVYGVFSVGTPFEKGMESEVVQGKTVGDAAKAAGVQHLVYNSVGGAERHTEIPNFDTKAEVEAHLKGLGLPLTIIRPVYFMENLVGGWATQRTEQGLVIAMPLSPDRKLAMIAVDDIGAFDALAFAHPEEWLGRELEIAGDELTLPETAALLGEAIGEPVTYAQIPWETVRSQSEDVYRMYDWFEREGYKPDFAGLRHIYPGLTSFRTWLAEGNAQPLKPAA